MSHDSNRLKSAYYTYFMFLVPLGDLSKLRPLSKILDPPPATLVANEYHRQSNKAKIRKT